MAKRLFSPEIKRIYSKYPALMRTATWERIAALCREGKADEAEELAKRVSAKSKQLRAQNVLARRTRLERVKLFAHQVDMQRQLRAIFADRARSLADEARRKAEGLGSIPALKKRVSFEMGLLRRALNKWITDGVWQGVLLGVRNTEASVVQIFKDNEESALPRQELDLMEERLSFGITGKLAGTGRPELARSSTAYKDATDKIYEKIVKKNTRGMKPSERVWEMTKRAELDMQRILVNDISAGTSSRDIAKKLEQYLSSDILDGEDDLGRGIYRSAFKNAMRLARTETNRAYTNAQASWAGSRGWVKGMMINLSSAHDPVRDEDECDENAGRIVSPEEFEDLVPFHPHCMCYGTIVIKDEYLEDDAEAEEEEAVRVA